MLHNIDAEMFWILQWIWHVTLSEKDDVMSASKPNVQRCLVDYYFTLFGWLLIYSIKNVLKNAVELINFLNFFLWIET